MIKMLVEQMCGLIVCGTCFSIVAIFVGCIINISLKKSRGLKRFTNKLIGTVIFDDVE